MKGLDRRMFLKSSAAIGAFLVSGAGARGMSQPKWRLAYMLGTSKGEIRPKFEELKAAGFEGVELLSPNELDLAEVLAASKATGIEIHGVSGSRHWQDTLSDPDEAVVERGLAAIRQEIKDTKAYGGTTVLVVPAVVKPGVSYEQAWERSQKAIRSLLPIAEEAGVVLAIEEVWNKFLLSPIEFARYVDEFESPWVKAYFDVGNVVEFGYPQEWIRVLGPRIAKIHVKEYAKPKRFDYALGEGEVDWNEVRQALIDIGYEGWITAEVPWTGVESMKENVVERLGSLLKI